MILPDVNVLVYAHHTQSTDHEAHRMWWESTVNGQGPFGMANLVLSGFVRIVTHPKIFDAPLTIEEALAAAEAIRQRPNCVTLRPGPRHWSIFTDLCRRTSAKGNHIPDAFLAALALDTGSDFITTDRGFARYPGLRWRHPLDNPDPSKNPTS